MSTSKSKKPAIGERVLWYYDDDHAWYSVDVRSDLISPINGMEQIQIVCLDGPNEKPFTVPMSEIFRMPEPY